jgi:hypothetical protein
VPLQALALVDYSVALIMRISVPTSRSTHGTLVGAMGSNQDSHVLASKLATHPYVSRARWTLYAHTVHVTITKGYPP